jgi:hypothetical protein
MERPVRILVGSYNVNGWKCDRPLQDWLYMNELPDIIAVGLQELSTNVLHSIINDDADGYVQNTWVRNLMRSFKTGDQYTMV